jgi:gamma-glutamylcyclotransferase (GGCT)/AIG2-like uncharacterized protein YtfP
MYTGLELTQALAEINSRAGTQADQDQADLDARYDFPSTRLAAYGTLMPGESNHALLADLRGTWVDGTVHGARFMAKGYPAFVWRQGTGRVSVSVLTSAALPARWAWLDEFEGVDYRRILVPVELSDDTWLVAYLYEYAG